MPHDLEEQLIACSETSQKLSCAQESAVSTECLCGVDVAICQERPVLLCVPGFGSCCGGRKSSRDLGVLYQPAIP